MKVKLFLIAGLMFIFCFSANLFAEDLKIKKVKMI
jgi:hypothetical protein